MRFRNWPSLRDWKPPARAIATRRAVYGKVHRASSDYRWIGWSAGFGKGPAPLENDLALGSEDSAVPFYCWRSPGASAVKCYRSRAFDAAGRPAGLEKQVLSAVDGSVPAAALAVILLNAAVPFDDSVWWESWRDPRWASFEYHLPIPEEPYPPLTADEFFELAGRGIRDLLEAVPGERLEDFYAKLLAGQTPVILPSDQPLTPLALAAILLPLDPSLASNVTLAGGFPSSKLDPARLAHWSAVACPPQVVALESAPPPEFRSDAASLVRLIERGADNRARVPAEKIALSSGGEYLTAFLKSDERWFRPGERGARSLMSAGPWPVIRQIEEAELLRERVRDFAATVGAMPDSTAKRHLATKADLLRAMILALCPGSESIEEVDLPTTGLIPALYFAGRIEAPDWVELGRYSAEEFAKLAHHSLKQVALPAMVAPVKSWLEECTRRADLEKLRNYAATALRHFSPVGEFQAQAGARPVF